MTVRIFIWINNRCYTTASYIEAVKFCALYGGMITSCGAAFKKDKLQYCGEI